ncbi:hypothetical protein Tco_0248414 [Tanacetum coccineum]
MASLDHRLNPLFSIKECMSCGALYTRNCGCSKGSLEDKILVPKPPHNCTTCGDPVDGLYCRPCAFVRKCLNEGWYTIHDEYEILNTSESSNHNTNVVSAPREPFVVNQDPGENSSQSPLQIDHNCCFECGDSLDDIFCQRCTCKSCGKGSQQEKKETPAQSFTPYWDVSMINDEEARDNFLKDVRTFLRKFSHALMDKQYQQEDIQELMSKLLEDVRNISEEFSEYINCPSWNHPLFYFDNDDDEYTVIWRSPKAITPDEPSEKPEDPLIIGEEELSTIPEKVKSSVEDLVPIPNGSKGVSDDISDAESLLSRDIPITSLKIDFLSKEFAGKLAPIPPGMDKDEFDEEKDDCYGDDTLSDNDSFENIDYVEALPPDSELVSLEEVEDVILRDKLSNVYLLISKIEALNDDPTLSSFSYFDNSFSDHTEETSVISSGDEIDVEVDDSFTFVIQTFLPFLTYPVDSLFLYSFESEDTIFDPDIFT